MKTVIKTKLNKIKFEILKTRQTKSVEVKPDGAMRTKQTHTPIAQDKLISSEDFLRIMRTIKGMFQSGSTIAATNAIF